MHRAAWKGHVKVVEVLLSNGADIDSKNKVSTLTTQTSTICMYLHMYVNMYVHIYVNEIFFQ